jgi:putative FmdB family regulatory protein
MGTEVAGTMPLYEYRCRSCHEVFEVLQKYGDRSLRKCERCGGKLEKLISRTSFLLKGGGWFADGYGSSSSRGPGAGTESGKSSSEKKAEKKSPAPKGGKAD